MKYKHSKINKYFSFETVIARLIGDFNKRLKSLDWLRTADKYITDIYIRFLRLITHKNNSVGLNLFCELQCTNLTIESLEKFNFFISALDDDAYFGLVYVKDELYNSNDIFQSEFTIKMVNDVYPATIYIDEINDFLDWHINCADNEFTEDKEGELDEEGELYDLYCVTNWDLYPKQYKLAYDYYCGRIDSEFLRKVKHPDPEAAVIMEEHLWDLL